MKLGLQIVSFDWPGGPVHIGPTLAAIARAADEAGLASIWVMDHFFFSIDNVHEIAPLEAIGREVIPAVAEFE